MVEAAGGDAFRVVPNGRIGLQVWKGETLLFGLDSTVIGPGWAGSSMDRLAEVKDGRRVYEETVSFRKGWRGPEVGEPIDFRYEARQRAPDAVTVRFTCRAEKDAELVGVGTFIWPSEFLQDASAEATLADGSISVFTMPPEGLGTVGDAVDRLVFKPLRGAEIDLTFRPACLVNYHKNQLRLWPIGEHIPAGQEVTAEVTVTLPGTVEFQPRNDYVDMSDWFPFENDDDFARDDALGMDAWLDAPAGKHGFCQVKNDRFVFEDGTLAKFWGTNVATTNVAVPRDQAEKWSQKWAKYGVNLVRFHKFARPTEIGFGGKGIMRNDDGTKIDPELAPRFDYFHSELWKRGIYVGWSAIYQYRLSPADKEHLRAYQEFMDLKRTPGFAMHSAYLLACFCPDVQDRMIEMTMNLLERKNTVTGKTYAESPGLAYIELHNEDDIFFGRTYRLLEKMPTYKEWFDERYSGWLKGKYGSQAALKEAWGNELKADETLAAGNIDATYYGTYGGGRPMRRQLDNYLFLFHEQDSFYKRFVDAIRRAGYRGAICGSCWQARTWLGHLFNVYSDREVGFIDRHNYAGGGRVPMLSRPGSGLLSAGMQQVGDRPFGLSEWAEGHQWAGEQVPVIGVYGMGLQGWDLSAHFGSNSPTLGTGRGFSVSDHPMHISQYPAMAMMLYRGDLEEGRDVAARRVSVPRLFSEGEVGFSENFSLLGGANIKEFSSVVPQESLAAGRVVLDFVNGRVPEPVQSEVGEYLNEARRVVRSSTGQLVWDYSGRGFFTVDTPGDQAVIGFCGGREHRLGDVTIVPETGYANIYISSLDPEEPIATANRLLVTCMARTLAEGTLIDNQSMSPIEGGDGPLLVEPVRATITIRRDEPCRLTPLDHLGRLRQDSAPVPVSEAGGGRRFDLDGARSRAFFYLVEFTEG